ncbi:MAG TPA: alpha/beta hydrolase [Solirubrobacterales bacterium]|nr:alpha/beta hydrolase [Solirubrobacterales bacterium]
MTERFCDVGRGVALCYETFGDPEDAPILLVMGLATQMIAWPEEFCERLADRSFHVVRFDNRDIGRSTHFDFRPPTIGQLVRRRFGPEQYTLSDMAEDSAVLLRELEIAPAHVVGASMGGMIAQVLAAEQPEVVRSLTSIMSTTGSRWHGQPALSVYRHLLRPPPRDRDGYVERAAAVFGLVGSTGFDRDEQYIRERAAQAYDRGFDVRAGGRQLGAIAASGDRRKMLQRITAPTLVIHGSVDKMVRPSGGRATAKAIPGARLMEIEGMGHDLPRGVWPRIVDAISEHARAADGLRGRAEAAIRPESS